MDHWAGDRVVEITQAEQQKEFKKWGKFKRPLRHIKCTNIHTIWVPEGERERERGRERIWRHKSWKLP